MNFYLKILVRLRADDFQIPPHRQAVSVVRQCKKTANPQMAHLVFADTIANTQKPKEPFFANAPTN